MFKTDELSMSCKGISQSFGSLNVLHDVNLDVFPGEIVSVVGPSGCGKSTWLRAIIGTHLTKEGTTTVFTGNSHEKGRVVKCPGRDRGIVYQKYTLFPFLTAVENVALGLMLDETTLFRYLRPFKWRKIRKEHLRKAEEFLVKLKLEDAIHSYPESLSGGMRQRVAIAQALIMEPEILLLDEPFGALDEATREELQIMLLELYQENIEAKKSGKKPPYTIMIVTHELNEAIYVADRIVGLSQYWNWKDTHQVRPGATIVYDKLAPIYTPTCQKDWSHFVSQREEIRKFVFDPNEMNDPEDHKTIFKQIENGEAGGIFAI